MVLQRQLLTFVIGIMLPPIGTVVAALMHRPIPPHPLLLFVSICCGFVIALFVGDDRHPPRIPIRSFGFGLIIGVAFAFCITILPT